MFFYKEYIKKEVSHSFFYHFWNLEK